MAEPTVRAPELPQGLSWLNVTRPLTLRELRGQIVVLDFWTYCCVNCMHVAPVLRRIEERFAHEPVVVLGVHSAKFDGEKDAARIEQAMRRYEVIHPVVVDRDMQVWSSFAVRSWPTLIVVRPDGTIAAVAPGEPDFDVLARFLEDELALARKKGTLAKERARWDTPAHSATGPLAYPGKVAVGPSGRIAVADSGHHRVLVLDAAGRVLHAVGSGLAGHADGSLSEAAFDDPQGIAWKSPTELYVADARAHTIARVDLERGRVTTIAGTGELGATPIGGASDARTTALRSPWDLLLDGDTLYVALAGSHQIGALDLHAGTLVRLTGTGAESIVDGPFTEATFSQPSGLALRGRTLYVADSETSAVRALDLDARTVHTVVGRGLFDFGDVDGPRETALLQHCLGVALTDDGALVVADTYNHKLRWIDVASGAVKTLAAGFAEPGGVAWDAEAKGWLVADTNLDRLVRVPRNGGKLEVLAVTGAPVPKQGRVPTEERKEHQGPRSEWFTTELRAAGGKTLAPGPRAEIAFPIAAPPGKKLAAGSPLSLAVEVSRRSDLLVPTKTELRLEASGKTAERVALTAAVERFDEARIEAEVVVRVDGIVCDAGDVSEGAVCEPFRAWYRLPVALAHAGGDQVELEAVAT